MGLDDLLADKQAEPKPLRDAGSRDALELLEDVPDLDVVIVPVGGSFTVTVSPASITQGLPAVPAPLRDPVCETVDPGLMCPG